MKAVKIALGIILGLAIIAAGVYLVLFMPKTHRIDTNAVIYNVSTGQVAEVHLVMEGKNHNFTNRDNEFRGNINITGSGFDKVLNNVVIIFPKDDPLQSGFIIHGENIAGSIKYSAESKDNFTITFYNGVYEGGDNMNFILCVGANDKDSALKLIDLTKQPKA